MIARLPEARSDPQRLSLLRLLLLAVLAFAALAPGISGLPPTDRDEARFVQATKQMLETGDYIDIRFQDEHRYKKPAGIYWLQSIAVVATGGDETSAIWRYRLVSLAAGIAGVLLAAVLGARMFGAPAGFAVGLMTAAMFGLAFEARIAKTDATLFALTLAAQTALAHIYLGWKQRKAESRFWWLAFWLSVACGVLVKGPITPLVSGLTALSILVLDRERGWWKELRPLKGLLVMLAVALPWLIAISFKSDGAFWAESVGRDLLGKVAEGQESHGAPPGTYFITYGLFMWPVGFIALIGGMKALNHFRRPELLFCLGWYIPFAFIIELTPTKLPHYPLPAYPALILLGAWALFGDGRAEAMKGWQLWFARVAQAGIVIVSVLLAAAAIGLPWWLDGTVSIIGGIAAIAALVTGWAAAGFVLERDAPSNFTLRRLGLVFAGAAVTHGLIFGAVAPSLKAPWLSRGIVEALPAVTGCDAIGITSINYHEPSLVFLGGTGTLLTNDIAAAAAWFAATDPCRVAVLPAADIDTFKAALPAGVQVRETARVVGMNYSKGRQLELVMLQKVAP
jgi:4-amino-4-deoxy-L-arabinose transferase-like glycosyltransferase